MAQGTERRARLNTIAESEAIRIRGQLPRVFTPAQPVGGELFAGRTRQLRSVLNALATPGQHAVIFGERGVGKTTLAGVIPFFWHAEMPGSGIIAPSVTCNTLDTYGTIWSNVVDAAMEHYDLMGIPQPDADTPLAAVLEEIMHGGATPELVRRFVRLSEREFYITIDEFDHVEDTGTAALMADTIKLLSDRAVPATLVIVGVADTVSDLIAGHQSTIRSLVQVLMPRMTPDELRAIVNKGVTKVGMTTDDEAVQWISVLSQGLPYYTHLLALNASIHAIERGRRRVELDDVYGAIADSVNNSIQSVMAAYHAATISNRREALYSQVLLACALTVSDDFGYFAPADIVEHLEHVAGRHIGIPSFIQHFYAFCEERRGAVLERDESETRPRYRFSESLLKPYVVLRGIEDGAVDPQYVLSLPVSRRVQKDVREGQ